MITAIMMNQNSFKFFKRCMKEANSEGCPLKINHFKLGLGLGKAILTFYTFYPEFLWWIPKYCQTLTQQIQWCPQRHIGLRQESSLGEAALLARRKVKIQISLGSPGIPDHSPYKHISKAFWFIDDCLVIETVPHLYFARSGSHHHAPDSPVIEAHHTKGGRIVSIF